MVKEMGEPTAPFTVMGETTGAVPLIGGNTGPGAPPLAKVMKLETLGEPRPVGMS